MLDAEQLITVNLLTKTVRLLDILATDHNMTRSQVVSLALQVLRERELSEGYQQLAAETADMLIDSGIAEVLEHTEW